MFTIPVSDVAAINRPPFTTARPKVILTLLNASPAGAPASDWQSVARLFPNYPSTLSQLKRATRGALLNVRVKIIPRLPARQAHARLYTYFVSA